MEIISIKDMLAYMETGKTFSMLRVRYDRKRKNKPTNGQIQEFHEAKLFKKKAPNEQTVIGRTLTAREQKIEEIRQLGYNEINRNPQHGRHYTRNIVLLVNGHPTAEIRKIHPPLVLFFNNKKVVP